MIRSSLLALLICSVPLAQADTKKTAAPDKAPKTEEAEKPAPTKEKPSAKAETKPAAKPDAVDPADQALLNHANKELKKLTPAETTSLLKLSNEGSPADLQNIPGIGETKSAAIKKARPIKSADQLIMVDGIGEVTFNGIVKWVKDGMPKNAAAAKPAAKPEPKQEPKTEPKPAAKTEPKPAAKADAKPAKKTDAAPPEVLKPEDVKPAAEKKVKAAAKTTAEKAVDKVTEVPAKK